MSEIGYSKCEYTAEYILPLMAYKPRVYCIETRTKFSPPTFISENGHLSVPNTMYNILLISQHWHGKQVQNLVPIAIAAITKSTVFRCQSAISMAIICIDLQLEKNSENNENRCISVGRQWFASIWWMSRSKTQRMEGCDNRISQWHQGIFCLIIWIADGGRLHNSTKGRKSSQCFGLYIHTYIQCYIYEIVNEQVSPCSIKQPWYHYLSPRI